LNTGRSIYVWPSADKNMVIGLSVVDSRPLTLKEDRTVCYLLRRG